MYSLVALFKRLTPVDEDSGVPECNGYERKERLLSRVQWGPSLVEGDPVKDTGSGYYGPSFETKVGGPTHTSSLYFRGHTFRKPGEILESVRPSAQD